MLSRLRRAPTGSPMQSFFPSKVAGGEQGGVGWGGEDDGGGAARGTLGWGFEQGDVVVVGV